MCQCQNAYMHARRPKLLMYQLFCVTGYSQCSRQKVKFADRWLFPNRDNTRHLETAAEKSR